MAKIWPGELLEYIGSYSKVKLQLITKMKKSEVYPQLPVLQPSVYKAPQLKKYCYLPLFQDCSALTAEDAARPFRINSFDGRGLYEVDPAAAFSMTQPMRIEKV